MNVELVDHMGTDATVANAARVSFNKHKDTFDERDEKLISYLADHQHWTPFAHPQITVRMAAPVSIRTQCFKQRMKSAGDMYPMSLPSLSLLGEVSQLMVLSKDHLINSPVQC